MSIPLTINSVDVYTDTDGDRTIVVWDESGNVVQSQSFYIQSTNGGSDPTPVALNFSIPVGNNFIIGTDTSVNNQNFGNNNPLLKRQGSQYNGYCNYPYTIDNIVQLKNSPYGTDWYYYFYNWYVEPNYLCESLLAEQQIVVSNSSLNCSIVVDNDAYCGNNGCATVTMTGGTAPFDYTWYDNLGNVFLQHLTPRF